MSEPYSCEKQYIGNFGHPVWENPTEHMVNAAFAHHGLRWQYVTYEVPADNLRAAFEGVKALGRRWVSVEEAAAVVDFPCADEAFEERVETLKEAFE